ncbi:MAG: hypothetical protein HRT40_01840 [Campylobacteraceae bacterium]|nr:hypothetical protein [Campylobacteraceae bacterium]
MVWYSSYNSRKINEVSVLAILEIIISISIYWGIAFYFNTYWHIITSTCIAPLLLLKSKESISKSLDLLHKNIKYLTSSKLTNSKIKFYILVYFCFIFIVSFNNFIFSIISLLIVSSLIIYFSLKDKLLRITIEICLVIGSFLSMHLLFIYINNLVQIDFGMLLLQFVTITVGGIISLACLISFLLITIVIIFKIISTFLYIKYGLYNISDNWYQMNFVTDLIKFPEIIPDIEKDNRISNLLKFSTYKILLKFDNPFKIYKSILNSESNKNINKKSYSYLIAYKLGTVFTSVVFPCCFKLFYLTLIFSSIFYRMSIKSTFWFYIPLLFLVKSPKELGDNTEEIGEFLSSLYSTFLAWIRLFFAIVVILSFVITYFEYYDYSVLNIPFDSMIAVLYINISSLELWKILQIIVAISTIIIFLWSNSIRVPKISNNMPLSKNFNVLSIFYLNIFRNWMSFFYFSSALIYFSYYYKVWDNKIIPVGIRDLIIFLISIITGVPF